MFLPNSALKDLFGSSKHQQSVRFVDPGLQIWIRLDQVLFGGVLDCFFGYRSDHSISLQVNKLFFQNILLLLFIK